MKNLVVISAALAFMLSGAQAADLDLAASKITIHVEKSGLFAAFAHNHIVAAPLASGSLDTAGVKDRKQSRSKYGTKKEKAKK